MKYKDVAKPESSILVGKYINKKLNNTVYVFYSLLL